MKITVNPPTEVNEVTGEEVAVAENQRVQITGKPVENTSSMAEPDNLAFAPMDRKPVLRDPAFQEGATQQDVLNYWTNGKQPTQDEMLHIQDEYARTGDEQLARFLTYKMTGNTEQLLPQDLEILGVEETVTDDPNVFSAEEINHEILATDDSNDYNPANAQRVANADLGNSPEMVVVQKLAMDVCNGQMSRQEAYVRAVESGIDRHLLYAAYNRLADAMGGGKRHR